MIDGASIYTKNTIIDENAPHSLKIEYSGGWGYSQKVNNCIEEVSAKFPRKFSYFKFRDPKVTGRFEVSVYKH